MQNSMIRYRAMRDSVPEGTMAVVDNSAFGTHIEDSFFHEGQGIRLVSIARDIDMLGKLDRGWRDNFVFPDETRMEFNDRTERMRKWTRWCYRNEMPAVGDALRRLRYFRNAFVTQIIKTHKLEDCLAPEIRRLYLPHIINAMISVSSMPGVRKNPGRIKYLGSKEENGENDALAFAKAVALSYIHPVTMITADSDMSRMAKEFYSSDYPARYGFPKPAHSVEIMRLRGPRLLFYSGGKFQREVALTVA